MKENGKAPAEPWVNLFQKNRAAENGLPLQYIPPEVIDGQVVVQLEKEKVDRETAKWKCALIVYSIGECPGYNNMCRFIAQSWNSVAEPEVYLHEEGYYIVKFHSMEDMREILYAGPYMINYRTLILKPWTPDFDFNEEFPTEIPLWIKLPHLPMNCWGTNSLSRIASSIGTPVFADACTARHARVSFARVLIEVNITRQLPDTIVVRDPSGKTFTQKVIYEWKPLYCEKCQIIGHKCAPEPLAKPRKRGYHKHVTTWISKGPNQQQKEPQTQTAPPQLEQNVDIDVVQPGEKDVTKQTGIAIGAVQCQLSPKPQASVQSSRESGYLDSCSPTPVLALDMTNFPILSAVAKPRMGSSAMSLSGEQSAIPPDKGGKIYYDLADLECLIETRVKQHNAQAISKCIAPGWGHANNYSAASNGRIWVMWDLNYYTVTILRVEDQLIHCLVQNATDINCYLTIIYGFNSIEQPRTLWGYLKDIAQGLNSPWAICGDFNALLYAQDRLSGNPVQFAEIKDFVECLQDTHLNELPWRGDYFTWTNKKH
ncbi:uncharacterized protein LOC132601964 [Lycium barbarum]|uniref:uncharacterized protein LOC132601964 n=1 Tax=Lycium barbarum TaxID=112863 RepID=UPI00293E56B5|nr:uncharacterized protein LOC132601964 [Lycium barbarum]